MLNRIDRFNNVVVMQSAVPAYFWQNNGLTLLYPFSSKVNLSLHCFFILFYMFTKEQVLDAAIELTREKGFSAVSARSLGDRLGTTSRPIFSHFENMADVQKGIIGAANKIYQSFREEEIKSGRYVPYKASGMAYIRFAKEEKELFKLLFMRDRSGEQIKENPEEMEALIGLIAKQVNIDKEAARFFYLEMWAYTHGIASMIATGFYEWDEQLASRALTDVYEGLKHRYKNGGVRND